MAEFIQSLILFTFLNAAATPRRGLQTFTGNTHHEIEKNYNKCVLLIPVCVYLLSKTHNKHGAIE